MEKKTKEFIEREKILKKKLTPEFLETLIELCKLVGWSVDYTEIELSFIPNVYEMAGKKIPSEEELKPIEEFEDSKDNQGVKDEK